MSRFLNPLLTALMLCAALTAGAQSLVVRDWETRPNDQTARVGDGVRHDDNGRRAALIRIYTPFRASDLGVGGSGVGFVGGLEQAAPGELHLYVPRNSQKVSFTHPKYGTRSYFYESPIEEGAVYALNLTAEGKMVSLAADAADAVVWLDNDSVGITPVTQYIPYGQHDVRARLGSMVHEGTIQVSPDGPEAFQLEMEDENLYYGDVVVDVSNAAELWFRGNLVGVGRFADHLREGTYVIETRLPDHTTQSTTFRVDAGKTTSYTATPPVPHIGYLEIATEPMHGVTVMQADTVFTEDRYMQLPVRNYELTYTKRGYYPVTHRFRINRGETYRDSVVLRKIQYVPKTTGYAAVGISYASKPGVTFTLGGTVYNVDLSVSYLLGFGHTKPVDWYYNEDQIFAQAVEYRVDEWSVAAGYQFSFAERFGLTPHVGFMQQRLISRGNAGNNFTVNSIPIGARLTYYPIPHFGIFIAPEYAIPIGAKGDIKKVCSLAGLTRGGFQATLGLSVNL